LGVKKHHFVQEADNIGVWARIWNIGQLFLTAQCQLFKVLLYRQVTIIGFQSWAVCF